MIERRTFLQGLAATGAFAWLPGCGGTKKASGGLMGWDWIVAARDASRASPDHLSARAAEIVATKDFTRAVRFVRDNVRVAPPASSFDDAVSGVRWGADGALRAGLGTQRERADLLAAMLTAMGATATVKPAMLPAAVDAKAILRRQDAAVVGRRREDPGPDRGSGDPDQDGPRDAARSRLERARRVAGRAAA